jgi:hypothetical protein
MKNNRRFKIYLLGFGYALALSISFWLWRISGPLAEMAWGGLVLIAVVAINVFNKNRDSQ